MAKKDKARYEEECKAKGIKLKSDKKEDDGPKKPQSSFFLFSAD